MFRQSLFLSIHREKCVKARIEDSGTATQVVNDFVLPLLTEQSGRMATLIF